MKRSLFTLALALVIIIAFGSISAFAWNSTGANPQNGPYASDGYTGNDKTAYQWPFLDNRYVAGKNVISGYGEGGTSTTTGVANGTGRLPAMAWSSWNAYGINFINAQAIKDTAQAFVDLGLVELGYEYINMDDGTYSNNNLDPITSKFPNGFKEVGDYIHDRGLKFGMYSSGNTDTCGGSGGSWGTENSDATKYISWGIDYLKYDFCRNPWAGDGSNGAALAGPRVLKLTVTGPGGFSQVINPVDMEVYGAARYIPTGTGNATVPSIVQIGGYWKDIPIISSANWEAKSGSSYSAEFLRQTGGVPPVTSELAAMAITPGEALVTIKDVPAAGTYTVEYNYSTQQVTGIPTDNVDSIDYLTAAQKAFVKSWNYSATWSTANSGRYIQVDNITTLVDDYRNWVNKGPKRIMSFKNEPFLQKYDASLRVYDQLVTAANSATGATITFTVNLSAGDNYLRLYTEKREEAALQAYAAIKESLQRAAQTAGRENDIVLSICEWGYNEGSKWGYKVGDHWRSTRDIMSVATSTTTNIWQYTTEAAGWYDPAWAPGANNGSGGWVNTAGIRGIKYCYDRTVYRHSDDFNIGLGYGWNDADMMVIGFRDLATYTGSGNTITANPAVTSTTMARFDRRHDESHFNSWCIINSAIILGTRMFDVNNNGSKATVNTITKDTPWVQVISNKDAIALNQDPLGIPGKRIKCSDGSDPYGLVITERADVIAKPLENGDVAVMIFNLDAGPRYANKNHADYRLSGIDINVDEIVEGIGHLMVNKDEFAEAPLYEVKEINTKEVKYWKNGDELSEIFDEILALEPFYSMTFRITPLSNAVTAAISKESDDKITASYLIADDSASRIECYFILALYDDSGRLVETKIEQIDTTEGFYALDITSDTPFGPKWTAKAFIWDNKYAPILIDAPVLKDPGANKTELADLISAAELLDPAQYTLTSFDAVINALAAAKLINDEINPSQTSVNTAAAALSSAISELVIAPRITLGNLIQTALALDPAKYEPASATALANAISAAQTVFNNALADDAACEAAITALQNVIDGLVSIITIDFSRSDCYTFAEGNIARDPVVRQLTNTSETRYNPMTGAGVDRTGINCNFVNDNYGTPNTQVLRLTDGVRPGSGTGTGYLAWSFSPSFGEGNNVYFILNWGTPQKISAVRCEWWTDSNVTVPNAAARIEWLDGSAWKEVTNMRNPITNAAVTDIGTLTRGNWNPVTFDQVETTQLRMRLARTGTQSSGVGVGEWEVFN